MSRFKIAAYARLLEPVERDRFAYFALRAPAAYVGRFVDSQIAAVARGQRPRARPERAMNNFMRAG